MADEPEILSSVARILNFSQPDARPAARSRDTILCRVTIVVTGGNLCTLEHAMNASTTMTIRVPVELKEKLERLAQGTRRSRSFLAAEAVTAYVERELEIIEGIQRGLGDVAAGRVVPHEQVTAKARQIIEDAKAARA